MDPRQGILVVRLKSMGDILFTLPAVHALRAAFPEAPLTFLVSKEYSALLAGFRDVSSIIELDRGRFRGLHPKVLITEAMSLLRRLRRERLRLAIDFQGYGETALITWASRAHERWGKVYRPGRKWAYTRAIPRDQRVHPAEDFLALLQGDGLGSAPVRNQFVLPEPALQEAGEFFSAGGLRTDRATLFIQPFTSAAEKNWPLARYLEVARYLRKRGSQILFGGGPSDVQSLEPVRQEGFPISAGAPLLVSAGLAHLSTVVLGGDTGLLHLAVAMGKRVVMVMRSTLPGSTCPFQHKAWAIGPEAEGLITSITTETVNQHCARAVAELESGS